MSGESPRVANQPGCSGAPPLSCSVMMCTADTLQLPCAEWCPPGGREGAVISNESEKKVVPSAADCALQQWTRRWKPSSVAAAHPVHSAGSSTRGVFPNILFIIIFQHRLSRQLGGGASLSASSMVFIYTGCYGSFSFLLARALGTLQFRSTLYIDLCFHYEMNQCFENTQRPFQNKSQVVLDYSSVCHISSKFEW